MNQALELLKEELHSADRSYRRLLRSHAEDNTNICSFNKINLDKAYNRVIDLTKAVEAVEATKGIKSI